jgi:ferritin-like metal-binding protein YciE
MAAELTEMKDLLKHELGDLLYAERQFLRGMKKMSKEVADPDIKTRIEEHALETESQIETLNRAFESIGERPKAERCDAAIGLMEEHDSFKSDEKPSKTMLEAFDLGSGLRVEHYEIAGYRSAIAIAKVLGETQCAELLGENLRQEEEMAKFLERNAAKALKRLNTQQA